jgi:integrase/recombinase XerD
MADLDASLVGAFLNHLEAGRSNSVRTRNARLAAVHALFRHAAVHRPGEAAVIQRVLAIPPKRFDRRLVSYLTEQEITALLAAPDRRTWTRRRDHDSTDEFHEQCGGRFDDRECNTGPVSSDTTSRHT